MIDIAELAKRVHDQAVMFGWHDPPQTEDDFIERMCNNLHDEVCELHEAWRNNQLRKLCDKAERMRQVGIEPLTCLEEELADIVIRTLENAVCLGVDIEAAIVSKDAYNRHRAWRHGGKRS